MRQLVSTDWLEKKIDKVKILDASWHLPNSDRNAQEEYKSIHIKNSLFFDIDKHSNQNSSLPHMLPSKNDWEKRISLLGWGRLPITKEEHDRTRDGLLPYRGNARAWSLAGRCVMDAWWQARQALRPERETLSFVTKLLFPNDEEKQKIGIDASNMDEEWATRPDEVIEYCLRDAALPLDIMEEIV